MANVVKRVTVSGITEYLRAVEQYKASSLHMFALFTGSLDADGESWCSDCVKADPVVIEGLKSAPEATCFITCYVGDRPAWKDPKCPFRSNPDLKLKSIPTLAKLGSPERLVEGQCADLSLVQMLFEEE